MVKVVQKISILAQEVGISIAALEKRVGCSNGVFNNAIKNDTDVSSKWLVKLLEIYPNVSAEWLLRDVGDMIIEDHNEFPTKVENELRARIAALIQLCEEKDQHLDDVRTLVGLKKTVTQEAVAAC